MGMGTSLALGEAQTWSEAADFASRKRELEVCVADLKVLNKNALCDEKLAPDHTDKKLFRNLLTPNSVCLPFWA